MSSNNSLRKLNNSVIVIVGPTGSGKTSTAISLAKKINGEIISADSRAVYKNMNIGTAKPTVEEMDGILHYGIDLIEPNDRFTVADWKSYAEKKIKIISERGKIPIVVGGSGLYVDALVYNYSFTADAKLNYSDRKKINEMYKIFGIDVDALELRERIKKRIEMMFCNSLFDETRFLVNKYGWGSQAMKSDIYQFVWKYLIGELSIEEAKKKSFYADWHLAKRQMTWFKRNNEIDWLPLEKIESAVINYIYSE